MRSARNTDESIREQKTEQILNSFQIPKTPAQVEKQLGIKKLKLRPFLKHGLITLLNPSATKGRFYIVTSKTRRLLGLPLSENNIQIDWNTVGWVLASPRQRTVILKVLNSVKRTSDEIMSKALKMNQSITRISTKAILSELIDKGLVETELTPDLRWVIRGCPIYGKKLRRYYWLSEKGRGIQKDVKGIVELQSCDFNRTVNH